MLLLPKSHEAAGQYEKGAAEPNPLSENLQPLPPSLFGLSRSTERTLQVQSDPNSLLDVEPKHLPGLSNNPTNVRLGAHD